MTAAFVAQLPDTVRARFDAHDELAAALAALWRAGAERWPDLRPPVAEFVALLARVAVETELAALAELDAAEPYLIAACLDHQDAALRSFESEYFGAIDAGLNKMNLSDDSRQEVVQKVREKLYVAREDGSVPLRDYAGKGSLRSFLRVMATRTALNLIRAGKSRDKLPERKRELLPDTAPARTPELQLLKERHRDAFQKALHEAAAELEAEERNLLRMHLVDDLTIDDLAALHKIHRATAARRLARIRTRLAERTRTILNDRLDLTTGEFTSIVQMIQSQLDMSMRQLLESRDDSGS